MKLTIAETWEPETDIETASPSAVSLRNTSPEKQKLDHIRQISNVIQALENVVVQCEDAAEFENLQNLAKEALISLRQKLRVQIHLM